MDLEAPWWQQLGSPGLDALIAEALKASPTLAAAQAQLRQAQELQGAQERATQLLRTPGSSDFAPRLQALHQELARQCREAPDSLLLALISLSGRETRMYSATHAMLVASVCMLVAGETLGWPEAKVARLGQAALSMNIAMTALQDDLAQQTDPLTAAQIDALIGLIALLAEEIPSLHHIAGHEDLDREQVPASDDATHTVARKRDPGPMFPWERVLAGIPLRRTPG